MDKIHTWFITAITQLGKDVYSLRAGWNHVYLALYVFLAVYGALKVPSAYNTIIVTTGGVVSVLFTNYVLSAKAKTPTTSKDPSSKEAVKEPQDDSTNLP